jgi:hypothetical protein
VLTNLSTVSGELTEIEKHWLGERKIRDGS